MPELSRFDDPRDYRDHGRRFPPGYARRETPPLGYKMCRHLSAPVASLDATPLADLLQELNTERFAHEVSATIRDGRELVVLQRQPIVERLANAIRRTPDAPDAIERVLDELFAKDFRTGEVFTHTDAVMAILLALKKSESPHFERLAGDFADVEKAELSRVRRFARLLLQRK